MRRWGNSNPAQVVILSFPVCLASQHIDGWVVQKIETIDIHFTSTIALARRHRPQVEAALILFAATVPKLNYKEVFIAEIYVF